MSHPGNLQKTASVDEEDADDDGGADLGTWSARAASRCPGLAATANFFTQIAPSVYISISFTLRMASQEYPEDLLLVDSIVHSLFVVNLLARLTWYPIGTLTPMWQIATIIDIANLVSFAVLLTSQCRWPILDGSFVPGEQCASPHSEQAVPAHTWFDFSFMRAAYMSDLLNVVATGIALFNDLMTQLSVYLTSDDMSKDAAPSAHTHEVFAQPMFPLSPRGHTTVEASPLAAVSVKPRSSRSRIQLALVSATVTTTRGVRRCCPNTDGFCWRLTKFSLSALAALFICSVIVYVLEVVGEAPVLREVGSSVLWRQYLCDDGSISNRQGAGCDNEALSPFVAFYFVLISLSTVGYGDFSPSTVASRLFVLVIIILGVIAFGNAASTLLELMQSRQRPWESLSYVPGRMGSHVAVLGAPGSVSSGQLLTFLSELFASDVDGTVDELALFRCVLLCPESGITAALRRELVTGRCSWYGTWIKESMLHKGLEDAEVGGNERQVSGVEDLALEQTVLPCKSDGAVVMLQGDPNDDTQLRRAAVSLAQCVFILSDSTAGSADAADQYAMQLALRCMLLLRQSPEGKAPGSAGKLRVLLRLPTSVAQAISLGIHADSIVCSDQCDSSLAVYNAVAPGASAALGSLLVSTEPSIQKCATPSQLEYAMGAGNEVYSCVVPPNKGFHQFSWTDVVAAVYFLSSKNARKARRRSVRAAGSHEVSAFETCTSMCSSANAQQPREAAQDVDRLLDLYAANCGIHLIGFQPPGDGPFTLGLQSMHVHLQAGARVFGIAQDQAAMDRLASMDLASYFAAKGSTAAGASAQLQDQQAMPSVENPVVDDGIELTQIHPTVHVGDSAADPASLAAAPKLLPAAVTSPRVPAAPATIVQDSKHATARAIYKHAIAQQHVPAMPPGSLLVRGGHVVVLSTMPLHVSVGAHIIQLLRCSGQSLSDCPIVFMLPEGCGPFNPFTCLQSTDSASSSGVFKHVHVLHGCCFDQLDLLRAGCMTARRIVLFGTGGGQSASASGDSISHSHGLLSASALWTLLGNFAKVTMLFSSSDTANLLPSILLASPIAPRFPRIRRSGGAQSRYVQMRLATAGHALKQLWYAVDKLQGAQQAALSSQHVGDEQSRAALALGSHLKSAELAVLAAGQRVTSGVATSLIAGSWAKPHMLSVARSLLGFASPGLPAASRSSDTCVLQSISLSSAMMRACSEDGYADWPPYWKVHQYCLERLCVLPVGIIRNATSAFAERDGHGHLHPPGVQGSLSSSSGLGESSREFPVNSEHSAEDDALEPGSSRSRAPKLVGASQHVLRAAGGMFARDGCVVLSPIADSLVTDTDAVLCFASADTGPLGQIVRLQRSVRQRHRALRIAARLARKAATATRNHTQERTNSQHQASGVHGDAAV